MGALPRLEDRSRLHQRQGRQHHLRQQGVPQQRGEHPQSQSAPQPGPQSGENLQDGVRRSCQEDETPHRL